MFTLSQVVDDKAENKALLNERYPRTELSGHMRSAIFFKLRLAHKTCTRGTEWRAAITSTQPDFLVFLDLHA